MPDRMGPFQPGNYGAALVYTRYLERVQRNAAAQQQNVGINHGLYQGQDGSLFLRPLGATVGNYVDAPTRTIDKLRAELKAWHGDLRA